MPHKITVEIEISDEQMAAYSERWKRAPVDADVALTLSDAGKIHIIGSGKLQSLKHRKIS